VSILKKVAGISSSPSVGTGIRFCKCLVMTAFIFFTTGSAGSLKASQPLTIAVASNFKATLEMLVDAFSTESAEDIRIVAASTGVLYAQIVSGAPFDLFLAADTHRPTILEQDQLGVMGSRFTYAIGQLVLWIPGEKNISSANLAGFAGKLSIANPDTAPYGLASRQYLKRIELWESIQGQLVFAKNITQAFQYVSSGNAQAGLVAWSVLKQHQATNGTANDFEVIASAQYSPIEQQAIRLINASNPDLADKFCQFLKSDQARDLIQSNGYGVPASRGVQ
jgi:molybdate transport system substrate-binding protein